MSLFSSRADLRGELLVLYDGECVLCNGSVDFLLRRDTEEIFLFASLQGTVGAEVLTRHGEDPDRLDSLGYVRGYDTGDEELYFKSEAVLRALDDLGGFGRMASWLRWIPRSLRDYFYDIVAENRYDWFGQYDECRIPDSADRQRFLD